MNNQCKIVEDLLPLYHDGVCSDESRALIEDHLSGCAACRSMLVQIDHEVKAPAAGVERLDLLSGLKSAVQIVKRKSVFQGIAITCAVLVLILSGWGIWWYAHEYCYYLDFVEKMEPLSVHEYDDDGGVLKTVIIDNTVYHHNDDYSYRVNLPLFLFREGTVVMSQLDGRNSVTISRWNGVDYVFHVFVYGYGKDHYFIVDSALNQYYPDHWSEEVIQQQDSKLAAMEQAVRTLVDDAIAMWPFTDSAS